jgi:pyrroline-5-carboxylate reductase
MNHTIAFIGGGNMASAIIGGLIQRGMTRERLLVVEPFEAARQALVDKFQVLAQPTAHPGLSAAEVVVWAVKPQLFKEACTPVAAHTAKALHLSVAAGIPSDSIARWLNTERVVRSMPNTPALIGLGMTGLFARGGADAKDRNLVESIVGTTGEFVWLEREAQLDAVTALSGSGPAYVFYFLEAMVVAGTEMGLSAAQSYQLAMQTFKGASALAQASSEPPQVLRERVTSKGGTTYAAITSLQDSEVGALFVKAMHAAEQRARELGQEFGKD